MRTGSHAALFTAAAPVSQRELDTSLSTEFHPVLSLKNPQKMVAGVVVAADISIYPKADRFCAASNCAPRCRAPT